MARSADRTAGSALRPTNYELGRVDVHRLRLSDRIFFFLNNFSLERRPCGVVRFRLITTAFQSKTRPNLDEKLRSPRSGRTLTATTHAG